MANQRVPQQCLQQVATSFGWSALLPSIDDTVAELQAKHDTLARILKVNVVCLAALLTSNSKPRCKEPASFQSHAAPEQSYQTQPPPEPALKRSRIAQQQQPLLWSQSTFQQREQEGSFQTPAARLPAPGQLQRYTLLASDQPSSGIPTAQPGTSHHSEHDRGSLRVLHQDYSSANAAAARSERRWMQLNLRPQEDETSEAGTSTTTGGPARTETRRHLQPADKPGTRVLLERRNEEAIRAPTTRIGLGIPKEKQKAAPWRQQRGKVPAGRLSKQRKTHDTQQSDWLTEDEEPEVADKRARIMAPVVAAGRQTAEPDKHRSKRQEGRNIAVAGSGWDFEASLMAGKGPQAVALGGEAASELDTAATDMKGLRGHLQLPGAAVELNTRSHSRHWRAGPEHAGAASTSGQQGEGPSRAVSEPREQDSPQWRVKKSAKKARRLQGTSPASEVIDLLSPKALPARPGAQVGLPSNTQMAEVAPLVRPAAVQTLHDAATSSPVPLSRQAAYIPDTPDSAVNYRSVPETPAEENPCALAEELALTEEAGSPADQHRAGSELPGMRLPAVIGQQAERHAMYSLKEGSGAWTGPDLEETPSDLQPPLASSLDPAPSNPSRPTTTSDAAAIDCSPRRFQEPEHLAAVPQDPRSGLAGPEQQDVNDAATPSGRQHHPINVLMVAETPAGEDADDSDGDSMGPSWAGMERVVSETPADHFQGGQGLISQTPGSSRQDVDTAMHRAALLPDESQQEAADKEEQLAQCEPARNMGEDCGAQKGGGVAAQEFWPSDGGSADAITDTQLLQAGLCAPAQPPRDFARQRTSQPPSAPRSMGRGPVETDAMMDFWPSPAAGRDPGQEAMPTQSRRTQSRPAEVEPPAELPCMPAASDRKAEPADDSVVPSGRQACSEPIDFWPSPAAGSSLGWDTVPTQGWIAGSASRCGAAAVEQAGLMMQFPQPVTSVASSSCGRYIAVCLGPASQQQQQQRILLWDLHSSCGACDPCLIAELQLTFHPDVQQQPMQLATTRDGNPVLLALVTRSEKSLGTHPDGHQMMMVTFLGSQPQQISIQTPESFTSLLLAADGHLYAAGKAGAVYQCAAWPVWATQEGMATDWRRLPEASDFPDVTHVAMDVALHTLVACSSAGTVAMWDTQRLELLAVYAHPCWAVTQAAPVSVMPPKQALQGSCSPQHMTIAALATARQGPSGQSCSLFVGVLAEEDRLTLSSAVTSTDIMLLACGGPWVAAATRRGTILLWDLAQGTPVEMLIYMEDAGVSSLEIRNSALSGLCLVAGSGSGKVLILHLGQT